MTTHRTAAMIAAIGFILATGLARADSSALGVTGDLLLHPLAAVAQPETAAPQGGHKTLDADLNSTNRPRFGEAGAWYWSIGGGVGLSGDSTDPMGKLTFGTFLTDSFEFNFGARGWYFAQDDGRDAVGASFALNFRWHFVNERSYSVYAQTGIGVLQATHDVPPDGTLVNFTPTFGMGATFELGKSDTRLDLGARWHHISNATTSGSDDNPARDGILLYFAFIFPF